MSISLPIDLSGIEPYHSNGATPDQKSQQILSIAPILKGQASKTSTQSNGSPHQQPPPQQQNAPAALQGNLIDFDEPNTAPAQPTKSQPSFVSSGLQEPIQPNKPIKRVDTETEDVDEFVDAKPM